MTTPNMSASNIACVLHGPKDLRIERTALDYPTEDELQVSIRATGLCGSDLHYYQHGRNGDIVMREPMALGHESSGIVSAVGSNALDFKAGDKVALEVGVPCSKCSQCGQGRYNICKQMRFRSSAMAFPHFQGTLQTRLNHPARWCHKIPDSMSWEEGALLEPLGVAIHACNRAQLKRDETVLVLGAGAVGVLAAAAAKTKGASTVLIADIDEGRVKFATENNFAHKLFVITAAKTSSVEESLDAAKQTATEIGKVEATDGQPLGQVDVVIECTGVPSCVQAAIHSTKPGGKVLLVGMGSPIQTLPIAAASLREVDLLGVCRYASTYPAGIKMISENGDGTMKFQKLVTHRVNGLENAENAFGIAGKTKDGDENLVLKVMIES